MDYETYDFPSDEPERYWTVRRVVYLTITLLTLIAFLVYTVVVPLIEGHTRASIPIPTPTVLPRF